MDCPELIEPLFPQSFPLPHTDIGKWAIKELDLATCILRNGTKGGRNETEIFYGIKSQWKCVSSSREVINAIYSVT